MAQIQTQTVTIRLSKLVKGDAKATGPLLPASVAAALEDVVGELVADPTVIVEIGDGEDD